MAKLTPDGSEEQEAACTTAAEIHEIHFGQQSFPLVPTYTIFKGWLVVGYYLQAVHGCCWVQKEIGAWKPGLRAEESLK